MYDTLPNLTLPVGFGGGLEDPDTGLVHFGYRDYDPSVGRFTAKDPLGDTGGDHDLYDYCLDDPVSMHDPLGLDPFLTPLAVVAGVALVKAVGALVGYGGAKLAAYISDKIGSAQTGQETRAARDGVDNVMPYVTGTSLAGMSGIVPVGAAAAMPAIGQGLMYAGGAMGGMAGAVGDKLTNLAQWTSSIIQSRQQLAEGLKISGQVLDGMYNLTPPTVPTAPGFVGAATKSLYDDRENIAEKAQAQIEYLREMFERKNGKSEKPLYGIRRGSFPPEL